MNERGVLPAEITLPRVSAEAGEPTAAQPKGAAKVLQQLKHFLFPENPVDGRVFSRMKRGAIHYAHTGGWSAIPPFQRWIRQRAFEFQHENTRVELSADDLTHLWVADEVLAERVYDLNVVPFTPDLVLDCGANIGLFTLLAAKRWPRAQFVCVEPHPTTFSFLSRNLALNSIQAVKLQCAVGAEPELKFLCNEGAVFQSVSDEPSGVRAFTVPFDSLLPRGRDMKLLIKMDIEGAEETALNAMRAELPESCFIFIELHRGDASLQWIRAWAAEHRFEFTEVRRRDDAIDGFLARPK
jgi:FkbM family methyltransferase